MALAIGPQDVTPVGESIREPASKPLGAKGFSPFLTSEVCCKYEAVVLTGLADHLEGQFGSGLGKGGISEFIQDRQMKPLQPFVEALQPFFFPISH